MDVAAARDDGVITAFFNRLDKPVSMVGRLTSGASRPVDTGDLERPARC